MADFKFNVAVINFPAETNTSSACLHSVLLAIGHLKFMINILSVDFGCSCRLSLNVTIGQSTILVLSLLSGVKYSTHCWDNVTCIKHIDPIKTTNEIVD